MPYRIRSLAEQLAQLVLFVGDIGILFAQAIGYLLRWRWEARETLLQMALIGAQAVPMVVITSGFTGAVLALYSAKLMLQFGVGSLAGGAVALAMARELGPVVTGVVVAARSASAIAAEIGSMKVTEQIDALRALAVPPVQYLVVPRLVACVTMLPVLGVLAFVTGVLGGYLVAVPMGISTTSYLLGIRELVDTYDVFAGLLKTVVFGAIIALVGSRAGLRTEGGAAGVGRATTGGVVVAVLLIYVANFFLAYLLFGGR
ncbi:MAG: ABC transporter permease [Armatimonadetes bacterium]|nr:ABC transporter permease [Armatimonadota bacterium]